MKDLIAKIKNNLEANHSVEADDIYSVLDLFTDDTLRNLEQMHDQTGLEYRELIRIAVVAMSYKYFNDQKTTILLDGKNPSDYIKDAINDN